MTLAYMPPGDILVETFNEFPGTRIDIAIAIPARNEEERIGRCLTALAGQVGVERNRIRVVVALNNTKDRSLQIIRQCAPSLPIVIEVIDFTLPKAQANAGFARRIAMDHAARGLGGRDVLLSTDADTRPDSDWVAQNLAELAIGTDAVAGHVTAEPDELAQLDPAVVELGAAEWEYQNLLAELDGRADPIDYDPWPKHNQRSGASMAVTVESYGRVGGVPAIPVGEDRALLAAIAAIDGRIRHALSVHVVTSARTVGRAVGGMADALRTRGTQAYVCDDILEPATNALRRAKLRAEARRAHHNGLLSEWCRKKRIPLAMIHGATNGPFGRLWQSIEAVDPSLRWTRLTSDQLAAEIASANTLLSRLRTTSVQGESEPRAGEQGMEASERVQ
jgi:hypothetical protein